MRPIITMRFFSTFVPLFCCLLIAWCFFLKKLSAQSLPFQEAAAIIEKQHGVKIFYKAEWIEDALFESPPPFLSLTDAINTLLAGKNLSAIYIDDLVVLVPSERPARETTRVEGQIITIGNPAEAGRRRTATLSGRIYDGSTNEALVGAVIYDEKTKSGATADPQGNYAIELPVGEHNLRVSFVGYEDRFQAIRLISDDSIDFGLFESSIYLDEFTVTAQRAEANLTRTQMSVITLDARTLKQLPGAYGEADIIRSFSMLPGVQTIGEFGTGFHIRGGSADQNLILVEDVPIFNTSHLFGLISIVNPDMVSNVTMMKAGLPARYGERASAVIDIRKSGVMPEKTQVKGGIGLLNGRLMFETPLFDNKASFALGGRSSYSSWLLGRMPNVDLMNSDAGFYDLSAVLSAEINPKNNFTLFAYQSGDNFSYAGQTEYSYYSTLGSFQWNKIFTDRFKARLSGGLSEYEYQVSEHDEFIPGKAYQMNSSVSYQNLKLHFDFYPQAGRSLDFGLQAFRYGIEPGSLQPVGSESLIAPLNIRHERALEMAAYVNTQIEIGQNWSAETGLRYVHYLQLGPARVFTYQEGFPKIPERHSDSVFYEPNEIVSAYLGVEPRISLRYMLDENSSVKLSYNRNHQFINLVSNSSLMTPADVWKLSDKHLKPLVSNQFAAGYFRNFYNNMLEASVEVYYKHLKNLIDYKNGASILLNPHIETDLINASGYNYGAEFYINRRIGRINGWLSYTYSVSMRRSNQDFEPDQINSNRYFPSDYDRPHNLVINANYEISRRWRFNAVFAYSTGRPVTLPEMHYEFGGHQVIFYSDRNKYRLPDYHRLDVSLSFGENLRVNYRGKSSWSVSVINVYGRKNPWSVFYKKDVPSEINNFRHYSLYQLYIIGRPLPTITYSFSF